MRNPAVRLPYHNNDDDDDDNDDNDDNDDDDDDDTNRVITLRTNFIMSNVIVTTIEVIVYGDAYKEGTEEHLTNLSDGDDPCWEPFRDTIDIH